MGTQGPGGWGSPGGGWAPPPAPGYGGPAGPAPGGFGPPPPAGYGPPGYGHGPPGSASGRAIAALVCAIASWVVCGCFTSLPAVFLAWSELKDIDLGQAPMEGKSLATAALWVGGINAALYLLIIVIYAVIAIVVGVGAVAGP